MEPSHQMKTALANEAKKPAIGKLAAQSHSARQLPSIWMQETTTLLPSLSIWLKQNLLPWSPMILVIADFLLDNSSCTIIHHRGAVSGKNRSCVGEATATMLRGLDD